MIKIIRSGTAKIKTCPTCGCKFLYEEEDLKIVCPLNNGDQKNNILYLKCVNCPECEDDIIVDYV